MTDEDENEKRMEPTHHVEWKSEADALIDEGKPDEAPSEVAQFIS